VKLFSNFCRDRNLSAFRHFGAHDKNLHAIADLCKDISKIQVGLSFALCLTGWEKQMGIAAPGRPIRTQSTCIGRQKRAVFFLVSCKEKS
jgi:hypothetical protein